MRKALWLAFGLGFCFTIATGEDAAAQQAAASLRAVQSGDLTAGTEFRSREMCLDGGLYVVAFRRGTAHDRGAAIVDDSDNDTRAFVWIDRTDEDRWGWRFFVTENECVTLHVGGGRALVYRLLVSIDW